MTEADLWEGKIERSRREELYIFMRKLSGDKCVHGSIVVMVSHVFTYLKMYQNVHYEYV